MKIPRKNSKNIIKTFTNIGASIIPGGKGSHTKISLNKIITVIPKANPVKVGTLKAILRTLNIDIDTFILNDP